MVSEANACLSLSRPSIHCMTRSPDLPPFTPTPTSQSRAAASSAAIGRQAIHHISYSRARLRFLQGKLPDPTTVVHVAQSLACARIRALAPQKCHLTTTILAAEEEATATPGGDPRTAAPLRIVIMHLMLQQRMDMWRIRSRKPAEPH